MFQNAASPDPRLSRYDHFIVHVTATAPHRDLDDDDIDRIHRRMGFSGCGYNALILRDGTWVDSDSGAVTRPIGRQGAHVGGCGPGWNGRSFGVSLIGGVDIHNRPEFNMTDEQMHTLEAGIRRFIALHPHGDDGVTVMGHRDIIKLTDGRPKKACPCFDVMDWWAARKSTNPGPDNETEMDEDDSSMRSTLVDQPNFWTVASGDTLGKIVSVTGISLAEILQQNPDITNPNLISVGQVIRLS